MLRRIAVLTAVWLIGGAALAQDRAGMAVMIVNHVDMARQAVAAHDPKTALDRVGQALTMAQKILLESAGQPQPVLVTISQDLERTTTYRPVKKLKNGELTADRLKHDTSVREAEVSGTVAQLDVTGTAERLGAARAALERQDWNAADQLLLQIQEGVIRTRVDGNVPLLQAQLNLELARARILEDKPRDAVAPMRAAAVALADFGKSAPGPDAQDADSIRQKILDQTERVAHDPSETVDWINSWLATVERLERKTTPHH